MPISNHSKLNLQRIRPTKIYSLQEIAETLDRKIGTVRYWVYLGMPVTVQQRPKLVLGADIKKWHQDRQKAKKRRCLPNEMFCFRCRAPRKPMPESTRIVEKNEKTVSITSICDCCGQHMCRIGSASRILEIRNEFGVASSWM